MSQSFGCRFLICLFICFFMGAGALPASTIFSIGGNIQSQQYSLSGYEFAVSFIAGANETITGASVVGSGGSLTLQIEANAGGMPSNTALTGGTGTATLSNPAAYTATTALNTTLVSGTEYWMVLSGTGSINLSSTAAGTVAGVTGEWTANNGGTWTTEGTGSGYYYPNAILTGTVSAAPEPDTSELAFVTAGFALAFGRFLRRGKRDEAKKPGGNLLG